MAALPYMQLYVADYLADTAHLDAMEHGAYLLLIMNYWQRGKPLPNDARKLARIARVEESAWPEIADTLLEFFEERDGCWHHSRIDNDLATVEEKSQKAKAARAQRTSNERATDVKRPSNHKDTDTDTEVTPNGDNKRASARSSVLLILTKVVDEDRAKALIAHRQKMKAGLTEHTAKLLATALSEANDPNAAADEQLLRGWKSWKPGWSDLTKGTGPPQGQTSAQAYTARKKAERLAANGNA